MAKSSVRDRLLRPVTKTVTVSGEKYDIRQMPAFVYGEWLSAWSDVDTDDSVSSAGQMQLRAAIIVAACLVEDGKAVFAISEAQQVAESVSAVVLTELANEAMLFNGLGATPEDEEPEEVVAKNS